jgi:tetratricopeptide (TPR) repeat protein
VSQPNPYQLLGPAGALFQAELHLAEWCGLEGFAKQFTLWRVRPELGARPGAMDLLLADLNQAAKLTVAPVTQVLDVWRTAAGVEIAVEHVSGVTLAEAIRCATATGRPLPVHSVVAMLLEVAWALEAAHGASTLAPTIVHGDLGPERVVLGFDGAVKLTGFGFGRFLPHVSPDGRWAAWHRRCYQPRERVVAPASLDARSDLFSLGVILLEATTGATPYGSEDPRRLVSLARSGATPVPLGTEIPAELEEIVARACAPHPDDRYPAADAIAEDLHRLLLRTHPLGARAALVREMLERLGLLAPWPKTAEVTVQASSATLERTPPTPVELPALKETERPPSPVVGRDAALRAIGHAVDSAWESNGRAVILFGAAGMGRTRLLAESRARLISAGVRLAWLRVKARHSERAVRHAALMRLLGSAIGISAERELGEIAQAVDRLRSFGLDGTMIAAIRGVLGAGPPLDPDRTDGLLADAVVRCVSGLSWEQLTVVACDDLQWVDDASFRGLALLMDQVPYMPVVVLLTAHAGFEPAWAFVRPTAVALEPLGPLDCEQIVLAREPRAASVQTGLSAALVERTGGTPVLIETMLDLLLDGGQLAVEDGRLVVAGARALPALEDVVRARLDRLDDTARRIAVVAALSGPAFSEQIVAAATNTPPATVHEVLDDLVLRHRVLRRTPEGLSFPHERLRLAVMDRARTGGEDTRQLRARLARTILAQSVAPSCAVVDHAAELLADAGALERASDILLDSATSQERRGDYDGAAERIWRAREMAATSGKLDRRTNLALLMRAGRAALKGLRIELGEQALKTAIKHADTDGDPHTGAAARVLLCRLYTRGARVNEAMLRAWEALPLAERTGEDTLMAEAFGAIAECYQQTGEYGPDLKYIEQAIHIARARKDGAGLGQYLHLAVNHAAGVGRIDQTWQYLKWARAHADATRDTLLLCQLLRSEGLLHLFTGDFEASLKANLQGIQLSRRHGVSEYEIILLHNTGDCHLHMDNVPDALYYFNESHHRSRAARFDRLSEANEMFIGFIEATYLRAPAGLDRLRAAIQRSEDLRRLWNLTQGRQLLGRAHLMLGDRQQAVTELETALRLAEQSGVRFFIDEATRWLDHARQ